MKKIILFVSIAIFSLQSFAGLLNISGNVYRSLDFNISKNLLLFSTNSNLTVEIEDSTGQREQHLLQYKNSLNLTNRNISRVTIYAP